ncbi:MAG: hypothetical protein MR031_01590 [Tenericutes bacterium]|nr:hypothetical protein [Mycoplasmatota bacterium]
MEDAYDEKYEYKKELDSVDKQIDEQESLIKECNNANETFSRIRKSMDRCIDLLSRSVKGPSASKDYEEMHYVNESEYSKLTKEAENNRIEATRKLEDLREQRQKLIERIEEDENEEEKNDDRSVNFD